MGYREMNEMQRYIAEQRFIRSRTFDEESFGGGFAEGMDEFIETEEDGYGEVLDLTEDEVKNLRGMLKNMLRQLDHYDSTGKW